MFKMGDILPIPSENSSENLGLVVYVRIALDADDANGNSLHKDYRVLSYRTS